MPSSSRRLFLQNLAAGAAVASVGAPSLLAAGRAVSAGQPDSDDPILEVGDSIAVADTAYGKVRGFILNGIHCFRGVPYGADTGGENRFMPPQKPQPWPEVRSALWWGHSAPQEMSGRYSDSHYAFADHWNYDEVSEDCLRINLWTPGLSDGGKRPVLVWLHGGGFVNGNGVEQDGYDGENLARFGDVVFCSLNHRLGPIGFSNFAKAGGASFAASGNVGMLDIVAALEWVRDNVANFGGDPGNVTIIGQSGGGAKVCTLTAMPSAKGLFHKAVALSGSSLEGIDREYSENLGQAILAEAGLTAAELGKLQSMPWPDYLALAHRAAKKFSEQAQLSGAPARRGGFQPVADGSIVTSGMFYSDPAGLSSDVPMMITSTRNEQSPSRIESHLENISLEEVKARLHPRYGDATAAIVDAYAGTFPSAKPVEVWSLILSNRRQVVAAADAKFKQRAPVYVAWFGWQPPLFDQRLRAFHCLDICFWFRNTDRMLTHTGGGARPRRLAHEMSSALLQFMRTGNPNGSSLPHWPAYTAENGETLILDDRSTVQNDPDREARKAFPAT